MADVFVTFAREDQARAESVARAFEAAGLDVFWDADAPAGQTWDAYVDSKLSSCKAVVALVSAHTAKRWTRGAGAGGALIAAQVDASPAPDWSAGLVCVNLANWNGDPNHAEWLRLLHAVSEASASGAAARKPRAAPAHAGQEAAPSARPRGFNPLWLLAALVVAALAIFATLFATSPPGA